MHRVKSEDGGEIQKEKKVVSVIGKHERISRKGRFGAGKIRSSMMVEFGGKGEPREKYMMPIINIR